jgi:putative ABC transport system permease protein
MSPRRCPAAVSPHPRCRPRSARRRLSFLDVVTTAVLGPRSRPVRAALSAVGIAIGIAALVAVLGIPASLNAEVEAEFERWGANVIEVYPGADRHTGEAIALPETAPAMVARIWPVRTSLALRNLNEVAVYRTDKVMAGETGGYMAMVAEGDLLGTLNGTLADGRWFDDGSSQLPTVVLGQQVSQRLRLGVGDRVWIGQAWWAVIGVLDGLPLYSSYLDSAAFLAPARAAQLFGLGEITEIMANAYPGQANAAHSVMATTVNPANPTGVNVSKPSDFSFAQTYIFDIFTNLALGLGAIALLVGAIGIANTMVVSVLERRGEIGLRRALGARTGQIALQFVLEAAVIGFGGGVIGIAFGAYVVFCFTAWQGIAFTVPAWTLAAGPAIAMAIGMLAGLYPALKAARQSPTVALRTV